MSDRQALIDLGSNNIEDVAVLESFESGSVWLSDNPVPCAALSELIARSSADIQFDTECVDQDTDNDGIGDNVDPDDDGDGVPKMMRQMPSPWMPQSLLTRMMMVLT